MLRFGTRKAAPNYLSGPYQRRLFLLVMSLGLIVIMMREVGKPDRWKWFEALAQGSQPAHEADTVDTRLPAADHHGHQPGTIRAPANEAGLSGPATTTKQYFPGVNARLLAHVRDDTIFRKQDYESWFNLLSVLRDTSPEQVRAAATGNATFLQLYQQPAAYRGELVTIAGTVRRCGYRQAPQNDAGIKGYYQIWLQAAGTTSSLYVVFVLDLPQGFPIGDQLDAEVTLTGFFFKRWAYAAQDTIRSAPVVLARSLEWQKPAPPVSAEALPWWPYLLAMLVGIALAVGAFWYRAPQNTALDRYAEDVGPIEIPVTATTPDENSNSAEMPHDV